MRVLCYNWVDYRDPEGRGGGVSVYQRNLMAALEALPDIEPGFVCAGLSHDLVNRTPRWEPIRHGPGRGKPRHWDLVNAQPMSPAHHAFGSPAQVSHPETEAAFCDLIARTGPWDVLHLNNLEGLPVGVLAAVRARFPALRIVFSLHNYYPVCPQVNLWRRERATCDDFAGGTACVSCVPHLPDQRLVRAANAVAYRLKCAGLTPGTWTFDVAFRALLGLGRRGVRLVRALRGGAGRASDTGALPGPDTAEQPVDPALGRPFADRRAAMVAAINAHCDVVLAVSEATRQVALRYGFDPAITRVGRIGTREAAAFDKTAARPVPQATDGTLTLAYLGYMRRDKGFYFLLDALEALPPALARRVRLLAAARAGDGETMARLGALGDRLAGVTHVDGYSHDGLDALLAKADIGVVPVLWHDNLPQVAIEMHARHIPLLTSDMGGAQELGRSTELTFAAGDTADFAAKLQAVLDGRVDFDAYWQGARAPMQMAAHVDALVADYRGTVTARAAE